MTFLEEVGKRIRKQRKRLGWTQSELVYNLPPEIEITDKQISRIELGRAGTTLETFKEISMTLGKTPDYFMLGHNRRTNTVEQMINEIDEILLLCEFDDVKSVLTIVRAFADKKG